MTQAPEKIHNWLNTQLSIARHYGGIYYMGHQYYIDYIDPEQPLVRSDIFSAEAKARKPRVASKDHESKATINPTNAARRFTRASPRSFPPILWAIASCAHRFRRNRDCIRNRLRHLGWQGLATSAPAVGGFAAIARKQAAKVSKAKPKQSEAGSLF
jgi:hypothetical protein